MQEVVRRWKDFKFVFKMFINTYRQWGGGVQTELVVSVTSVPPETKCRKAK